MHTGADPKILKSGGSRKSWVSRYFFMYIFALIWHKINKIFQQRWRGPIPGPSPESATGKHALNACDVLERKYV